MSVDVLEIDFDEDGPLREECLPKRHQLSPAKHQGLLSSNISSHCCLLRPSRVLRDMVLLEPFNGTLCRHKRASPCVSCASVLHERRPSFRTSFAVPIQGRHTGYTYDAPPPEVCLDPGAHNPFSQTPAYLFFIHVFILRPRSYYQAGFGYRFNDISMSMVEQPVIAIPEMENTWMGHPKYPLRHSSGRVKTLVVLCANLTSIARSKSKPRSRNGKPLMKRTSRYSLAPTPGAPTSTLVWCSGVLRRFLFPPSLG